MSDEGRGMAFDMGGYGYVAFCIKHARRNIRHTYKIKHIHLGFDKTKIAEKFYAAGWGGRLNEETNTLEAVCPEHLRPGDFTR